MVKQGQTDIVLEVTQETDLKIVLRNSKSS